MRVPSVYAAIKILWSNTKILTLKLSIAALKVTVGSASLDGAEDRQKIGVLCMQFPAGTSHAMQTVPWGSSRYWNRKSPQLRMPLNEGIRKNRCVGAPAQCAQDAGHKHYVCEYQVRRSAEGCNSLLRFCTLSRGRSLFYLRERCAPIHICVNNPSGSWCSCAWNPALRESAPESGACE